MLHCLGRMKCQAVKRRSSGRFCRDDLAGHISQRGTGPTLRPSILDNLPCMHACGNLVHIRLTLALENKAVLVWR